MRMSPRFVIALSVGAVVAFAAALGLSSTAVASAKGGDGGTITIAAGTPPLSADQGLDFTTQGTELYSVVNTPLLIFRRGVQGAAGSQILPGLAKSLPKISDHGRRLTFHLRKGLHYSNGQPVKASDERLALERDLKIPWQAASFVGAYVKGASAYQNGPPSGYRPIDQSFSWPLKLIASMTLSSLVPGRQERKTCSPPL